MDSLHKTCLKCLHQHTISICGSCDTGFSNFTPIKSDYNLIDRIKQYREETGVGTIDAKRKAEFDILKEMIEEYNYDLDVKEILRYMLKFIK